MRLDGRAKTGISLILGVLAGLTLVIVPGVLSTSNPYSTSPGFNGRVIPSTFTAARASGTTQTPGASSGLTAGSLLLLIGTILIPAIALSFLARYLTLKKREELLSSERLLG
jgi:hypothetical protein